MDAHRVPIQPSSRRTRTDGARIDVSKIVYSPMFEWFTFADFRRVAKIICGTYVYGVVYSNDSHSSQITSKIVQQISTACVGRGCRLIESMNRLTISVEHWINDDDQTLLRIVHKHKPNTLVKWITSVCVRFNDVLCEETPVAPNAENSPKTSGGGSVISDRVEGESKWYTSLIVEMN